MSISRIREIDALLSMTMLVLQINNAPLPESLAGK
jgi:hypothetical protein